EHGDRLAAVVIEGIPANNGLLIQRPEYMQLLRNLTEKHGALMILDEVITGFRVGLGGAAEYYKVRPDLLTYGKIIGGGMPVGAFGGRAEIMNRLSPLGPVYQAGTLSGNPVTMAAGLTTLRKLENGSFHNTLEARTRRFVEALRAQLPEDAISIAQINSIFWITFQEHLPRAAHQIDTGGVSHFNKMHESILDRSIYLPPSGYEVCFLSVAHTDDMLDEAVTVLVDEIRQQLKAGI
ncbi:MAG: aspartate aminotransferase family protein, partial [Candidatus Zixiibacteriota bacterium]